MTFEAAIIGGSGVGELLNSENRVAICIPTCDGLVKGYSANFGGKRVLLIPRHADRHRLPPHHVPYKAIARALHAVEVKLCLGTAAVGSLRPEWRPGTLAICSDFIDLSGRNLTLFESAVVHTGMADPFGTHSSKLAKACQIQDVCVESPCVYLEANGPRYESYAEIAAFRMLGADVVGMTAASEAIALREAGVPYECLAVVTNLAAGLSPADPAHSEVIDVMREQGPTILKILKRAVGFIK